MTRQEAIATATNAIQQLRALARIYDSREDGHDILLRAIKDVGDIKADLLEQEDWN